MGLVEIWSYIRKVEMQTGRKCQQINVCCCSTLNMRDLNCLAKDLWNYIWEWELRFTDQRIMYSCVLFPVLTSCNWTRFWDGVGGPLNSILRAAAEKSSALVDTNNHQITKLNISICAVLQDCLCSDGRLSFFINFFTRAHFFDYIQSWIVLNSVFVQWETQLLLGDLKSHWISV